MSERADIVRDIDGFEVPDIHSSSAGYAQRFSGPVGRWMLQVQEDVTQKLLPENCRVVMDAGGGHGQNIGLLRQRAEHTTILGSDDSCQELIREELVPGKVDFVTGHLTRLPFEDGAFDCSLSYRMITHLLDWPVHISELCRVSGRSVLIEFPVRQGFNALSAVLFQVKKNIEQNTRPYTLFSPSDVAAQFRRHDFELIQITPQFFWPMVLHRLHKNIHLAKGLEWLPWQVGLTQRLGSPVIARFDRRDPS